MAFTYFFRDMQTLQMIKEHIVPCLRSKRKIRVWDAGCAMGPEPYSLAITIRENMGKMIFRNVEIFASDVDGSNLFGEIIGKGVYPREQIQRIPEVILKKYFSGTKKNSDYKISDEMIRAVKYRKHDLLTLEPFEKKFGLILCKNVLLHFKPSERVSVIRMFHETLDDDGFFVTEQTQKIPAELKSLFEQVVPNAQIFRKIHKAVS